MSNKSIGTPLVGAVDTLFVFACDIEKTEAEKEGTSGFQPASIDLGAGMALFGDLRISAIKTALDMGLAKRFVIAGGDDGRYWKVDENGDPVLDENGKKILLFNRAEVIREILIHDYGVDGGCVRAFPSRSNTGGNAQIFAGICRQMMEEEGLTPFDFALFTNMYHLPRAHRMLEAEGLLLPIRDAESLCLLGGMNKNDMIRRLEDGLVERYVEEAQGIGHMANGTYKPRTDVAAAINPMSMMKVTASSS